MNRFSSSEFQSWHPSEELESSISSDAPKVEIINEHEAAINFPSLSLNSQEPASSPILLTIDKHPITLSEGDVLSNPDIEIDAPSPTMIKMIDQLREIDALEERQKPRAILQILSRHMAYAFTPTIDQLSRTNPEQARWIREHTVEGHPNQEQIKLSEIIEHKYAVCAQLSVVYLWLAQQAGIPGAIASHLSLNMKNIIRPDTGTPLFSSVGLGPIKEWGHRWVELQMDDGSWVPVDPSTHLVGDTQSSLDIFELAGYTSENHMAALKSSFNQGVHGLNLQFNASGIKAGHSQSKATGRVALKLYSDIPEEQREYAHNKYPDRFPDHFEGQVTARIYSNHTAPGKKAQGDYRIRSIRSQPVV